MLFKSTAELTNIIPTSKFAKIDSLLGQLDTEELVCLKPLVGDALLARLNKDYEELADKVVGSLDGLDAVQKLKVRIIRHAQSVVLFSYLANHSHILQSSFNMGGGWNRPSTDNYEALNDKENAGLDRDLWNNAKRSKEILLSALEDDALKDKVYWEEWQASPFCNTAYDILFVKSSDMHPLFMNLGEFPHLRFQECFSTIYNCQDHYISGNLGESLMAELIAQRFVAEKDSPWLSLLKHVKMALALFTQYEMDKAKDVHVLNKAEMQLSISKKIVDQNYATFADFLADSPLKRPEEGGGDDAPDDGHRHHCHGHRHEPHLPNGGNVMSLLN